MDTKHKENILRKLFYGHPVPTQRHSKNPTQPWPSAAYSLYGLGSVLFNINIFVIWRRELSLPLANSWITP